MALSPRGLIFLILISATSMVAAVAADAPVADSTEFRFAQPGYVFRFPRDHAAHPAFRTEWWYYTGQLTSAGDSLAPADLGFQLTFFRRGVARPHPRRSSAWALHDLYFAHLAISDLAGRRFHFAERISRGALGEAGADSTSYRVWIDDWQATLVRDGSHRLRASESGAHGIDLRLVPRKLPVLHGRAGLSRKGAAPEQASHYYSITRLDAKGTVQLGARTLQVRGEAWMDHEFSTGDLAPDLVGWDWFGLQFDDDSELMLYVLRRAGGAPDPASSGSWVDQSGGVTHLPIEEFTVDVMRRWKSPKTGASYPSSWRIRVPEVGLDLSIKPRLDNQELMTPGSTDVTYWEGAVSVSGARRGVPIRGRGYVELTGYAEPFRVRM
jgi:predicted secreted hydrolase